MGRLSIAMTTYNGEKYLKQQLCSLLEQSRPADEVVIRDDCSTDGTPQIVQEFIREHNLKHWDFRVNDTNMGFCRNFYQSIEQCSGDLIFLCDQDDIWNADKLASLEQLFQEHPQALSINTGFRFIDQDGNPYEDKKQAGKSNHNLIRMKLEPSSFTRIPFHIIMRENISPGCTMAFRASLQKKYLQKSSFVLPHDYEINYLAAIQDGLYFYDKPLISYRIHGGNTLGWDPKFHDRLEVADKKLETALLTCGFHEEDQYAPLAGQLVTFYRLRKDVLDQKSLAGWFRLLNYWKLYRMTFTAKERAGDFRYVIR